MARDAEGSHPLLLELSGELSLSLSSSTWWTPLLPVGVLHRLKSTPQPIRDGHDHLIPLCETLELVFRNGLKRQESFIPHFEPFAY